MSPRIAVIGTGYLGTAHAACMAELGFSVLGVDADAAKVEQLAAGKAPFFEPGLDELLDWNVASGRLRFTTSMADAASFADVLFLCVGTPQHAEGWAADTSDLLTAVEQLVPRLSRPATLVGKSTVPVGTAARLAARAAELSPRGVSVEVAWNPEFLREGYAVEDTLRPSRLVLGVPSAEAEKLLRRVYAELLDDGVPLIVTDVATAELVKVSANAFLATKISYINAVAEMCEAAGADVTALAEALGLDARIGAHGLLSGLGYGGGCLPKDVRAMMARAGELGVDQVVTLLWQVDSINLRQRRRIVDVAVEECGGSAAGRVIGVLGAAFKPFTDDVRDSPALDVAVRLRDLGATVRIYDPRATETARAAVPFLDYVHDVHALTAGADLLLHLTEWPEFHDLDPAELVRLARHARLVDGRHGLDPDRWLAAGWSYRALGRPPLEPSPLQPAPSAAVEASAVRQTGT